MNKFITMGLMACAIVMAQDQSATTTTPKKTATSKKKLAAKAAPTAQANTIPADATANPDGTYSYTDKAGKQWTYNKTPFGISKIENVSAGSGGAMTAAPAPSTVKSTDHGDTVLFEKPTPFGTSKWEKKKSELSDEERSIFQSQHPDKQ